jgi:DNA polymerase
MVNKAEKNIELKKLEEEVKKDKKLPLRRSNLVFGEGDPNCLVLFVGEAPGLNEDQQRRPFVGRAGQLLRKSIREIGWQEKSVYITNIVKRRPPENRDPTPEEIESYKPYLTRQIEIICPKIIVLLGRFSMNYFLPMAKITRDQGRLFKYQEFFIFPILHPAAALRGTTNMEMFRQAFKNLPRAIKKIEAEELGKKEIKPVPEKK